MHTLLTSLLPNYALCRFGCGPHGLASISIELSPFELDSEMIQTNIRLDQIHLPQQSFAGLAGQHLSFPINPEDGYIDASIYIQNRHHAIDISALSFGDPTSTVMPLHLSGTLHFNDLQSGVDAAIALSLAVPILLPYTRQSIAMLVENAIDTCAASSLKDLGKVMAELKKTTPYSEQLAEISLVARSRLARPI